MPFCSCILITECDQIQNHNVNSWDVVPAHNHALNINFTLVIMTLVKKMH